MAESGSGVAQTQCALDSGGFQLCASPVTYTGLAMGSHTFQVRALDKAGNTSGAQSQTWQIFSAAPVITFTSPPANPTNQSSPTLTWTATDAAGIASETCQLDAASPSLCLSPVTLSSLGDGSHTFTVRATDNAGNTGLPSLTCVLDTVQPVTAVTSKPANLPNQTAATFSLTAPDATSGV